MHQRRVGSGSPSGHQLRAIGAKLNFGSLQLRARRIERLAIGAKLNFGSLQLRGALSQLRARRIERLAQRLARRAGELRARRGRAHLLLELLAPMDGGVALTRSLTQPSSDLFGLGAQSTRHRGLQRCLTLRELELRTDRSPLLLEQRPLLLEAPLAQPPQRRRVCQCQCFAFGLVRALRGLTCGTLLSERARRVRQLPVQRLELNGRLRQPPLRRLRTLLVLLESR